MSSGQFFTILLSCILICPLAKGAVTKVEITNKTNTAGGGYDLVTGKVYFAVDPALAPNRIIRDLALAPKNAAGQVEFSADFYELRPRQHGNGTALVEISNRGGKGLLNTFNLATHADAMGDGFLLRQGFTLVWVGWEFDLPAKAGLLHAYLPVATEHGQTITGTVRSEWTGETRVETIPLGDRDQIGYPVVDAASAKNKLYVRDSVAAARALIPHDSWHFTDATHATLNGGFTPGKIYEVVYEAKDPVVAGLGLAGVRDFVSYLKFGKQPEVQRAIAFGVSQSGRFLREFLYDGFNEDEARGQVFDGIWAHVAGAGRGSFNHRFAQPSRDGHPFANVFYPVDMPPFDEEPLMEKAHRAHVMPKLFLTNGAYEYWGRGASLVHTTADGKADEPPSEQARIYFFSGSQHGVGSIPPQKAPAQNQVNTNDYRYGLRALLVAMQAWVKDGKEPPPSRFPRLDKGELTTLQNLKFPKIEGVELPLHKREVYRLDFSVEPPKQGPAFPTFVPQVDADGNDRGGIKMPEIAVPLASYTGWNTRTAAIGAPGEMLSFMGSWIPFPLAKVQERYANEQVYLDQIDEAGRKLAEAGYVLEADLPLPHERAAREWAYLHHS
jgi:Alpha/beta hydrolase domain